MAGEVICEGGGVQHLMAGPEYGRCRLSLSLVRTPLSEGI
jgi:hypothetical protein